MKEAHTPLHDLLEICTEQLRLCQEPDLPTRKLALLLERKEGAIAALDFAQLGSDHPDAKAQAAEIVRLEADSLEALRRHRDVAASELKELSSAKTARDGYLGRRRAAKVPRLIDRAG